MECYVKTRSELETMIKEAYNAGVADAVKTFAPQVRLDAPKPVERVNGDAENRKKVTPR